MLKSPEMLVGLALGRVGSGTVGISGNRTCYERYTGVIGYSWKVIGGIWYANGKCPDICKI